MIANCDLCNKEKEITSQIKLDPIEPEQGRRLRICKDCTVHFEELAGGGLSGLRRSPYESIAELLWAVTGLEIEDVEEDF